jgi:hypothetical protein
LSPTDDETQGGIQPFETPWNYDARALGEVLIDCNLAKQMGKRRNILDKEAIKNSITNNRLDDCVALEKKGNQPVLCIGTRYSINSSTHQDHNATLQWISQKSHLVLYALQRPNSARTWTMTICKTKSCHR